MSEYRNSAGRKAGFVALGLASILIVTLARIEPAQAQFVCVNAGNSADGASANGPQGVACGTNATANSTGALNTAVGYSANAGGANGSAFGAQSNASGGASTAIGYQSSATAFWSVAVGVSSSASGTNSSAIGYRSTASGFASSAIGYDSTASADNAFAAGAGATVTGANGVAVGNNANTAGPNGVAIGNGTSAGFANSVAIGNGATTTRANQISTGTAGSTYTMAGITSAASRAAQSGATQIVTSDASGNLATQSLSDLGMATRQDISAINNQLNDLTNRTNKAFTGVAMAFAMAGVPTLLPNEKVAMALNYGAFEGASGMALSVATRINANMQFNAGIAYGPNEDITAGRVGLRVGW